MIQKDKGKEEKNVHETKLPLERYFST